MDFSGILQLIGGCFDDVTTSRGLYFSLFLAGVFGGFSHCIVMCGPFVLSQGKNLKKISDRSLLPYHLGRLTTYSILAVLLSSVLNLAFLFLPIRSLVVAPILMTAGLIFMVAALPSLGKFFPWVGAVKLTVPYAWLEKGMAKLSSADNMLRKYLMGILLGFMPCGLIVAALMASVTAPSAAQAGAAMFCFGLGTMPALLSVSFGGHALKARYPVAMQRITTGAMVWSSLWLFAIAGFLLI